MKRLLNNFLVKVFLHASLNVVFALSAQTDGVILKSIKKIVLDSYAINWLIIPPYNWIRQLR